MNSQCKLKNPKCVWFFTISEMSSLLFLIRPQRMALLSWLRVSSSLCLTITSSFWAFSCSWSMGTVETVLPLVEKTIAFIHLYLFSAAYTKVDIMYLFSVKCWKNVIFPLLKKINTHKIFCDANVFTLIFSSLIILQIYCSILHQK